MRKTGQLKVEGEDAGLSLSLSWAVDMTGIRTQIGEKLGDPSTVIAASNLTACADISAIKKMGPEDLVVSAGFVNILLQDYKEMYYRHVGGRGHRLVKLSKNGPLWDPAEENEYPFSTRRVSIPLTGNSTRVIDFVDSPRIEFDKTYDEDDFIWMNGRTTFLIALLVLLQYDLSADHQQEEAIAFSHRWTIDWRLRPQVNGWNSLGDPMIFGTSEGDAFDQINRMTPEATANGTAPAVIVQQFDRW